MKKKQSPAILISVIVILVAIVGGWNLITSGVLKPSNQGPNLGASREGEKGTVANDVAAKVAAKKPAAKKHGPKLHDVMDGSLLVPIERSSSKPAPNDSSTSTQWYDKESGASKDPKSNG